MAIKDYEIILSIIANECTNLEHIDLGDYSISKKVVKLFQPNFEKVKVFKCKAHGLNNNDLNTLLLRNKKLQHFQIDASNSWSLNGNLVQALSQETLTYLELCQVHMNGMNFINH